MATNTKSGSGWLKWFCILLLLGAAAGGGYWYWKRPATKPAEYKTAPVTRGEIRQSVTANGQLTPVRNVEVGSQVSGIITEINVDFNSRVKQGEVLAKIDPATYERSLARADAELANSQAALELTQFNFKRAKELYAAKLISETEYIQTEVGLHQAEANVKIRVASVESGKVDLDRTTIYAPIDGVVISRNIEVGQTLASSFSTPRLFIIANDLAKMQIEAAVSEADVGGVENDQPVNFIVDAFPARQFKGKIKQVRYAPTTNQNVVTYTTIVEVDNADLKLRPGMTANATIITAQKRDILRIPNAAFRFRPIETAPIKGDAKTLAAGGGGSTNQMTNAVATSGPFAGLPVQPWAAERRRPTDEEREKYEASLTPEQREQYRQIRDRMRARFAEGGGSPGGGGGGFGGGFGGAGGTPRVTQEGPRTQTVYLLEKEKTPAGNEKTVLKPVTIKTGITDGSNTEVLEGLNENDVVVTGVVTTESAASAAARPPTGGSPFGSPFGGGPRRF